MISTTSQAMLNHHQQLGLFGDEDQDQMSTQMGFYSFPPNNSLTLPPLASSSSSSSSCHHSLKTFTIFPPTNNIHENLLLSSSPATTPPIPKQQHQDLVVSSDLGGPQLQRSSPNLWAWELNMNERLGCSAKGSGVDDDDHNKVGVSAMKMKKMKGRRKVREPRFCFKTRSDVDVLDDGYKWRKYGQKVVKNTLHPRSYYRCTQGSCRVKKRVERLAEDPRMVITTYEGRHAHSPSHDHEGSQSPSHLTNFFW